MNHVTSFRIILTTVLAFNKRGILLELQHFFLQCSLLQIFYLVHVTCALVFLSCLLNNLLVLRPIAKQGAALKSCHFSRQNSVARESLTTWPGCYLSVMKKTR
jgi:hypothetical protein